MLILVRHGESTANAKNVIAGQLDSALTEKGLLQAKQMARNLPVRTHQTMALISSPLERAYLTAKAVANHHKCGLHVWPGLVEQNFGDLEGLAKTDLARLFGDEQLFLWRRSVNAEIPGGESFQALRQRVKMMLRNVNALESRFDVLVLVGHNNMLRAMALEYGHVNSKHLSNFALNNCEPLILKRNNAR